MYSNFKWPIALMVILSLLYRLAFNDSIANNYETPAGYSAPKSIAQIEEAEKRAFEEALAKATEKPVVLPARKTPRNSRYWVLAAYKAKRKPLKKLN